MHGVLLQVLDVEPLGAPAVEALVHRADEPQVVLRGLRLGSRPRPQPPNSVGNLDSPGKEAAIVVLSWGAALLVRVLLRLRLLGNGRNLA